MKTFKQWLEGVVYPKSDDVFNEWMNKLGVLIKSAFKILNNKPKSPSVSYGLDDEELVEHEEASKWLNEINQMFNNLRNRSNNSRSFIVTNLKKLIEKFYLNIPTKLKQFAKDFFELGSEGHSVIESIWVLGGMVNQQSYDRFALVSDSHDFEIEKKNGKTVKPDLPDNYGDSWYSYSSNSSRLTALGKVYIKKSSLEAILRFAGAIERNAERYKQLNNNNKINSYHRANLNFAYDLRMKVKMFKAIEPLEEMANKNNSFAGVFNNFTRNPYDPSNWAKVIDWCEEYGVNIHPEFGKFFHEELLNNPPVKSSESETFFWKRRKDGLANDSPGTI